MVTPVAKTGLHCGETLATTTWWLHRVTPVAKTGLHCGTSYIAPVIPIYECDPGREDRAPLRLLGVDLGEASADLVTPVAKTGLHCGMADIPDRDGTAA